MKVLTRRFVLGGLIAAPAIVAATSLMPIRGAVLILPSEIDVNEIAAILDERLDFGDYEGNGTFARYGSYECVEAKLGLCPDADGATRHAVRVEETRQAWLAYDDGRGPRPSFPGPQRAYPRA